LKKLFIIRHAKSDQSFFGNDFERPLNDRGKTDAPVMAKRLMQKQKHIDAFVSSPAKRAKKTAESFCTTFGGSEGDIIFVSALYHATPDIFYEVIDHLDEPFNTVALFSHNPGITYFVNSLVPGMHVDNMPTCAIFAVQADIPHWSGFAKAKKEFLFFDYPKSSS
jgi:phosphohistidine phosphatase